MITSGFYNSLAGDRKYNSVQISRLFEGIINDGVFASIGESLMVVTSSGMTVNVGTGRAWFNNTWTDNDADIPLTLDAAEAILNRIDAIVLEVGSASDVRTNTIKIVKGTPGSVPVAPTMIQTTGKYQYPLATIYVGAGVTSIVAGNITSKINTPACPFVKVVGIEALTPIWENEFNTWFAALQAQMAGDVATNLQNQITANLNTDKANKSKYATCATAAATVAKVATQAEFSLLAGVIVVVAFTNVNTATSPTLNINGTGAKAIQCCGVGADGNDVPKIAAFQYDGTYYQLLNVAPNAINQILSSALQTALSVTNVDDALSAIIKGTSLQTYNAAGTYNYTVPAGVTKMLALIIGAGGGGGGGGVVGGGGGGGGGGYVTCVSFSVTQGQVIPVVVGTGGTRGAGQEASNGSGGNTGGLSSVNGIVALGGTGGGGGVYTSSMGSGGGGGGAGSTGGTGGGVYNTASPGNGSPGANGGRNLFSGVPAGAGGGGGGGGNKLAGGTAPTGGAGATAASGNGGAGGIGTNPSVATGGTGGAGGTGAGGGGGGGTGGSGTGGNGGNGGPGYVAFYSLGALPCLFV